MSDDAGVLQNDPNRGLRDRIDPGTQPARSSRDTLIMALHDLHEVARDRLATPPIDPKRRRPVHRLKLR
jgi:hypothetical protein